MTSTMTVEKTLVFGSLWKREESKFGKHFSKIEMLSPFIILTCYDEFVYVSIDLSVQLSKYMI
jgi:predicted alpha-1,6-mannanase (GH76 family)